jgi:molybdopterin/thiamine biosynthesis adenylyltransferase/rhodanese-related sulfurtransferase
MPPADHISLSKEELARYHRHLVIPGFGETAQQKLKAARVLVVGAGGLGSPLLLYLAAAGMGTIGIVDFDTVDESNLQRQILFTLEDVGKPKAKAAQHRLQMLNPYINIIPHCVRLSAANAMDILSDYDVIADGTDNFPTRYLLNDACVLSGKPNVYASVFRFEGQVSVFNHNNGPNYRDLYPTPPPPGMIPDCATGGVLGVLPGIIGNLQALEVIKVITGIGQPLSGKYYVFDALRFEGHTFQIAKREDNPLTGKNPSITTLIDYELFCGVKAAVDDVKEISPTTFLQWKNSGIPFQLIDVREPHEYAMRNIGGELIPLSTLTDNIDKIRKDINVVIHCQSGQRSTKAIRLLQQQFAFKNLYNLAGGIDGCIT